MKKEFRDLRRLARRMQSNNMRRRAEVSADCAKVKSDYNAMIASCGDLNDVCVEDSSSIAKWCEAGCTKKMLDIYDKAKQYGCDSMMEQEDSAGTCAANEAKHACGDCRTKCNSKDTCPCDQECRGNKDGQGICVDSDDVDPSVCKVTTSEDDDEIEGIQYLKSGFMCSKNQKDTYCFPEMFKAEGTCLFYMNLGCCTGTIFGAIEAMGQDTTAIELTKHMCKSGGHDLDTTTVCAGVDLKQLKSDDSSAMQAGPVLAVAIALVAAIL